MATIAHCIHGLGLGGAQLIVKQIVVSGGAFRHFVYSPTDGVFRADVERAGATVRIVRRSIPKVDPIWVVRLSRAMRRDGIDLVHGHLFGDSLHGYLSARAAGIPTMVTLHSTYGFSSRLQRVGYRWLLPRCDGVVACSDAVRDSFVEAGAVRQGMIVRIHNAIPDPMQETADPRVRAEVRRELGLDPNVTVIATVGRLAPEKGQRYLIEAFARLAREVTPRPRLILLGEGPLLDVLQAQTYDLGIASLVQFAGFRSDVTRLLPAFDVVAVSSDFEGLSMAILEAMATARCIVATDIPGVVEAVREGQEALIVPVRDVGGLAAALRQAVSSPELRERLGAAARRRFLELFTPERMAVAYGEFYREMTRDDRRRWAE